MPKKSASQIRRLQKRSQLRGDTLYQPPMIIVNPNNTSNNKKDLKTNKKKYYNKVDVVKFRNIIQIYKNSMENIPHECNAKERRKLKRKYEAVARNESRLDLEELLQYDVERIGSDKKNSIDNNKKKIASKEYILFIGRLHPKTTEQELRKHFEKKIGRRIEKKDVVVRMKVNKRESHSKSSNDNYINNDDRKETSNDNDNNEDNDTKEGPSDTLHSSHAPNEQSETIPIISEFRSSYAFITVSTPALFQSCLQLHQTNLHGSRLNIYMASSCRANSSRRFQKINHYKHVQEKQINTKVNQLVKKYIDAGKMNDTDLDKNVMDMLKRRSWEVVEKSLKEYTKRKDSTIRNFSSFLCQIVKEVENGDDSIKKSDKKNRKKDNNNKVRKKPRKGYNQRSLLGHLSHYSQEGVDMSHSENDSLNERMEKLFPSWLRGRGRGSGLFARS